jgi:hypothetical protein
VFASLVFVCICKSVVSVSLFIVVASCFSVLWIVPIMSEVHKKDVRMGLMFPSPIVSLTLYPLLSFRPRLFISLIDTIDAL